MQTKKKLMSDLELSKLDAEDWNYHYKSTRATGKKLKRLAKYYTGSAKNFRKVLDLAIDTIYNQTFID